MTTENTTAAPDAGATSSTADAGDTMAVAEPAAAQQAFWEQEAKKAFAKRDEAVAKVKALEGSRRDSAQAEMERDAQAGKFETAYKKLLDKHVAMEARAKDADTLASYVGKQVEARLADLPEGLRDVIPEGLSAIDRLEMIDKLAAHTNTAKKPVDPVAPITTAPTGGGAQPAYGTPEYLQWMKDADIKDVRASRQSWRDKLLGRSG